jgi:hypothetical protein
MWRGATPGALAPVFSALGRIEGHVAWSLSPHALRLDRAPDDIAQGLSPWSAG